MTDATTTTDLEQRAPGRALAIAAIHAYAEWLAANPDVPVPTHLEGSSHPGYRDKVGDATQRTREFAANHEGAVKHHSDNGTAWATLKIANRPIIINHTVFADRRPPAETWL